MSNNVPVMKPVLILIVSVKNHVSLCTVLPCFHPTFDNRFSLELFVENTHRGTRRVTTHGHIALFTEPRLGDFAHTSAGGDGHEFVAQKPGLTASTLQKKL